MKAYNEDKLSPQQQGQSQVSSTKETNGEEIDVDTHSTCFSFDTHTSEHSQKNSTQNRNIIPSELSINKEEGYNISEASELQDFAESNQIRDPYSAQNHTQKIIQNKSHINHWSVDNDLNLSPFESFKRKKNCVDSPKRNPSLKIASEYGTSTLNNSNFNYEHTSPPNEIYNSFRDRKQKLTEDKSTCSNPISVPFSLGISSVSSSPISSGQNNNDSQPNKMSLTSKEELTSEYLQEFSQPLPSVAPLDYSSFSKVCGSKNNHFELFDDRPLINSCQQNNWSSLPENAQGSEHSDSSSIVDFIGSNSNFRDQIQEKEFRSITSNTPLEIAHSNETENKTSSPKIRGNIFRRAFSSMSFGSQYPEVGINHKSLVSIPNDWESNNIPKTVSFTSSIRPRRYSNSISRNTSYGAIFYEGSHSHLETDPKYSSDTISNSDNVFSSGSKWRIWGPEPDGKLGAETAAVINGRRFYDDFTTIDWIRDTINISARRKHIKSLLGIRGQFFRLLYSLQGWILIVTISFTFSLLVYIFDKVEDFLFGLKFGICTTNFFKTKKECCFAFRPTFPVEFGSDNKHLGIEKLCPEFKPWSSFFTDSTNIFGFLLTSIYDNADQKFVDWVVYILFTITFATISGALTLRSKTSTFVSSNTTNSIKEHFSNKQEISEQKNRSKNERQHCDKPTKDFPNENSLLLPKDQKSLNSQYLVNKTASTLNTRVIYSAYGSGVPEVKTILSGFIIRGFLGTRTIIYKTIGLMFSIGAGLAVGKEGPFVHLATCVGNISCRLFKKYSGNDLKRRQILAAASSAGVALAFGSPIGGVLFSLEEISYYFLPHQLFRIFFCAIMSALFLIFLNPYNRGTIVLFEITYNTDWAMWVCLFFFYLFFY